ncbi:MAG: hypothetical protein U5R31_07150 [Acidimicrobiia bacterium]|nr:hypothetical protein [Acidimicrobiia bacterium]
MPTAPLPVDRRCSGSVVPSHDRRGRVVAAWFAALVLFGVAAGGLGSDFRSDFQLESEASRGFDILEEEFAGAGAGLEGSIVFEAQQGVEDPEVRSAMTAYFDEVATLEDDLAVISPYDPGGERQIASEGERAGQIAFARLEVPLEENVEDTTSLGREMLERAPDLEGLRVEIGGSVFAEQETPSPRSWVWPRPS